ncbi:CpaF family protein [Phytoactinopolyspora halotolerans]|uniref:CpaF family protein n=1 Tax=Phytoactinopolyspora halotolerans TaxID=1981512 RepID=A0A6L9SFD0_9ACTN|nr:ATPase, T2SS/T4P/T4SS family [Phytoactinopolyspora halotolerans]NEE03308.1 CpaF family protein [Phytoactinopolyspora halotolerans]
MDAVEIIVSDVRDLVRRTGIDPVAERTAVRRIADDVVGAYLERSLSRPLPPIDDAEKVTRAVVDIVAGYGPLQPYLDDPDVEEIWINEPGRVFVARRGRSELTTVILTADEVRNLVERMLKSSGRRVDFSSPFVDAMLPDGSRLHVVIPEVTRHWCVNIRKHVLPASSLDDLVKLGTLSTQAARFLDAAVAAGLNVLVSGGTQAGKTTVLNCLLGAIPAQERVITCEEVLELRIPLPDVVSMQTRQSSLEGTGEISLRMLVKEALRMRPDRLVVGEVRQEESFDLLMALNSGKPGACTLHANSAREAVVKLSLLPLLAGKNIGSEFIVPTVAGCVDLVVHVELDRDGRRRVREIVAVPGRVENETIGLEPVFVRRADELVRADGYPPHADRFARAGFDLTDLLDARPGRTTG